MKISSLLLVVLLTAFYSNGQASIRGRIKSRQQNLPSATVLLLNRDTALLATVVTNDAGEFIFRDVKPGNYFISSSVIGQSKFLSQLITVEEKNIVFPDIILELVSTELNEVTIKTKKPVFEQKIDRLVLNVQSSIMSSGSSVLEVLEKSPGVSVNKQNNTIAMNGKAGVRIMINGKLVQLPLDVAIQMLDGMSASNVEKIELITTPPAKYDAEGNAGIIHIVMKANVELGTNGSFGLTLGSKWAETLGVNFNLNHRTKNLAFFIDYSILRDNNLHLFKMTRQVVDNGFVQTSNDFSHRENITTQQNLNAGIEWKVTEKSSLSFSLSGYRRHWNLAAVTNDSTRAAIDSTLITRMNVHEKNVWQSATAGIGLQTRINSKNNVSFNVDYLYYHNNNPSQYNNELLYKESKVTDSSQIDLKKSTPIQFLIATADYKYVHSASLTLEAGIKGVISALDNNVLVRRLVNNVWLTDPAFTSTSNLSEQVGAAYISTEWRPGKQWQINSGVRYEYTHTSIGTPVQKNLLDRKYRYLFPTISLKKGLSKNSDLQFSYSKRITRPTYNDIAPFVFFWGPNSFSAGNTELLPAISDAVKLGYRAKRWIISLQFSHSKNEMGFLQPENDSANNLIYRSQNLKYLNTLGLTNTWSFNLATWWEVQTNILAQYLLAQTLHLRNNLAIDNYGINLNVTNSLRLPKDFAVEISGIYQSKTLWGISQFLGVGSINIGIQKKFGKGTLRFVVDDLSNTTSWKLKTDLPQNNLRSYFDYDFHSRYARFTYTRSFGNNKLKSIKLNSGTEEERKRIAN